MLELRIRSELMIKHIKQMSEFLDITFIPFACNPKAQGESDKIPKLINSATSMLFSSRTIGYYIKRAPPLAENKELSNDMVLELKDTMPFRTSAKTQIFLLLVNILLFISFNSWPGCSIS